MTRRSEFSLIPKWLWKSRDASRRVEIVGPSASTGASSERGSILVLALIYLVVASLTVLTLASLATTSLSTSTTFLSVSQMQSAARSTTNLAIANIRYTPLLGTNQTLNASPPSYCWGSGPTSSEPFSFQNGSASNVTSITMTAWCTTTWAPTSSQTRVVVIDACPASQNVFTCESNPYLQTQVTFDDYPLGVHGGAVTTACNVYCGQGVTIDSSNWSSPSSSQLPNAINVTSTAPPNPQVGGAYIPTATASSGQSVVITSSGSCVTLSGTVEFQSSGMCNIYFNDPGNLAYAAATQKTQSLYVGLGSQAPLSITATSVTATSVAGVAVSYSLDLTTVTTGGSGTGVVTYTASPSSLCTIGGSTLTATSSGTCVVVATKAGDASYNPSTPSPAAVITFVPATQNPIDIVATQTSATSQTLSITCGSSGCSVPGGAVTFTTSSTGCSISTNTLTATSGISSCSVTANLAGNGIYSPAVTTQTISFVTASAILVTPKFNPMNASDPTYQANGADPISLELVNSNNQAVAAPTLLTLQLGTNGKDGSGFYVNSSGNVITSVQIARGSSTPTSSVYFADTKPENLTLHVTGTYSGSSPLTVRAGPVTQWVMNISPSSVSHGYHTSATIVVQAQDQYNNVTTQGVDPTMPYLITDNSNGCYSTTQGVYDYYSYGQGNGGDYCNYNQNDSSKYNNYLYFKFVGGQATIYFGDSTKNDPITITVYDSNYNFVASLSPTIK